MLRIKKILFQIENNIETVINQDTILGQDLWKLLLQQHPADIATLLDKLEDQHQSELFIKLPENIAIETFEDSSVITQSKILITLDPEKATNILKNISTEKLTELFENLSDEDLKTYLKLLQKKQRSQIISRLSFEPQTAGRIMNSDVISLQKDFTVSKSINILQRLEEKKDLLQRIYVTDRENRLVGYINLDDLVLNRPETLLANIIHPNEICINTNEDQEDVANQMQHYSLLSAPVIDKQNHFLGVITAEDLYQVIQQEASEDVYKMSGISPTSHSYFDTSIWQLIWQRSPWLVGLLLLQSISSFILSGFKNVVDKYFIVSMFLTMLIGTGGNAGNQSSTLVIRGLATGEMNRKNGFLVLLREFWVSILISLILVCVSFVRVYLFTHHLINAFVVSLTLFIIIILSMFLGTLIPLLLERFNLDPAHSAAPFLATLMDVLGVLIYCIVVSKILG